MNNAKVIQVIVTESNRGLGRDDDPVRNVTQYWSLDGELLAEVDSYQKPKYKNPAFDVVDVPL